MRSILYAVFITCLAGICMMACSKTSPPPPYSISVVGVWREFLYTRPIIQPPGTLAASVPVGDTVIMTLRADSTYSDSSYRTRYTTSGTYLYTHTSGFVDAPALQFTYKDTGGVTSPGVPIAYRFNSDGDTLTLGPTNLFSGTTVFVRVP